MNKTKKRLTASIAAVIVLTLCLCITTYALVMISVKVPDNFFQTGNIKINLNDGKPVIEEHEFRFEPGMTVTKSFFIKNQSTWAVYYKVYFNNVEGGLADVLEVTVKDTDNDRVLFSGTMSELSRNNAKAADESLEVNEVRNMSISFHYPEKSGNSTQGMSLSFELCAEAVQTKNNPDKLFD